MMFKNFSFLKQSKFYFIATLTIFMLVFFIQLLMLNVLPIKYTMIVVIILLLAWLFFWFLQYSTRISRMNRNLGRGMIVALCIMLGVGNFYLYKTGNAFGNMADLTKVDTYSVIVLKDSSVKDINDLKDGLFGQSATDNQNHLAKTEAAIKKETGTAVKSQDFASIKDLGDNLYNRSLDAIIINEGYRGMMEEQFENFSTTTKVIYTFKITSENKNMSKAVNVTEEPFVVYISGIDTYGAVTSVSRSDVNMMAAVNPKTKQILLVSIPRDYYIPQTCQNNQLDKLTHTGIFGVDCTVSSMENFFDIPINYYVRVNFSSVIDIVDALGGITVDSEYAFSTGEYTFNAGQNELTGESALAFSRERYSFSEGDRTRGENQMRVITGIINKMISPSIIYGYAGIMDTVGQSFQTNMEKGDMTSLVNMQIDDMSGWSISSFAVNGVGETNWSPANGFHSYVMRPDMTTVETAKQKIEEIIK